MNRLASKEVATKDTQAVTASDIVILVVDDKPNIIKQISDICAEITGLLRALLDEASALSACEGSGFSAILISMALPNDTPVDLRRKLKTNHMY